VYGSSSGTGSIAAPTAVPKGLQLKTWTSPEGTQVTAVFKGTAGSRGLPVSADGSYTYTLPSGTSDGSCWFRRAGIAYFDEAELAGTTGGRLLELARQNPKNHAEAAAGEIRHALARRGPEAGRSHALDRIGLAQCHFLLGDLTGAVAETHRAVDAASGTRSNRVRAQLGELYPYTVGNSAARPVREARNRIRDLLST
jgi:hypothetical protein